MAWSGGVFTRLYNWVNDRDAGIKMQASRMDGEDNGFATGINQCMNKDGSNSATGNLNLGGFRFTNAANGTARSDLATLAQEQDGAPTYAVTSGTNTVTATLAPAPPAYANGQIFWLKFANTTTGNSTVNINGLGALNTYYTDGTSRLLGGENLQNQVYGFVLDASLNSAAGGLKCINPSPINTSYTGTGTGFNSAPTCTVALYISWPYATVIPGTGIATGSSSVTFTITGGPSIMIPLRTQSFYTSLEDNTAAAAGSVTMTASSAVITLGKGISFGGGSFTASGTKGWANGSLSSAGAAITYLLT